MYPIKDFNLDCFINAALELLRADETIQALHLLDNLPGFYRDNQPEQVTTLKRDIMARLATSSFYATSSNYELSAQAENYLHTQNTLRAQLVDYDVEALNAQGSIPHIVDMGPGEYWLPRLLKHKQRLFTYEPVFVNHPSFEHYQKHFAKEFLIYSQDPPEIDRPKIFFACEIIEHLWQESELRYEMERRIGLADVIHISTPCYTFDVNCMDWRVKQDLGHLRTYTPQEFDTKVKSIFPEYEQQTLIAQILHSRLKLKSSKFEYVRNSSVSTAKEKE